MQIISIQILRALAAILVAVGHAQSFMGTPLEKLGRSFGWSYLFPWPAGVDLFFVISGFIMVYSSERLFGAPGGGRTFVLRRVTRIVPLYWAASAFVLIKMFLRHKEMPGVDDVATSFLFIPWDSHHTGFPRPFYELGWTLNYEVFFYAVFALFIGLARARAVALTTATLVALVALGAFCKFSNPVLYFWTQPIVLEFVFGMGLALLAREGVTLPRSARYALMAAGAAAFYFDFLDARSYPHDWITPNDFLRVIGWGVPAAMILAGAVLKPREASASGFLVQAGARLGDASYALYLCHPIAMSLFAGGWYLFGLDRLLPAAVGVGASLLLSIFVSLLVYRWFERPMTDYLQSKRRAAVGLIAA